MLDLQCLRSLQRLAQGGNGGEGGVVRLVFDYVRKDRQERRYLIEDVTDREVCMFQVCLGFIYLFCYLFIIGM